MNETIFSIDAFPSEFGWMATVGNQGRLCFLTIGNLTEREAIEVCTKRYSQTNLQDWNSTLRRRLIQFAENPIDDFLDVEIDASHLTNFQQKVVDACRQILPGETSTYRELAERSGSPRAARAVGNTMAANRFPLIVPCHRVIATDGTFGGYSARQGVPLKKKILVAEKEAALNQTVLA